MKFLFGDAIAEFEGVAYLMHDLFHTKHKLTFFQLPTMRATQINGYSLVEDGDVVCLSTEEKVKNILYVRRQVEKSSLVK